MSDRLSSNQLQLENLPNELFLEILQYIDPIDLRSFKNLNKRIDSILQVLKLSMVVQWQEEDDLEYLSSFAPTQIIRLEMRDYWLSLNLYTTTELRSLILDCTYLSKEQLDQVAEISLPCLERLSIDNVTYDLREPLLYTIFRGEHFPALKTCQLKLRHIYNLQINDSVSSPKNVLRSLAIDKWTWYELGSLLNYLPNLRRLEANFEESWGSTINYTQHHLSMRHLQITLKDPLNDMEKLLKLTPNLVRLRIRGNLEGNTVVIDFEKMAKFLAILVPHLQHFDCELHCYSYENRGKQFIIQQLHPLFKKIQCLSGRGQNQCYATDIMIYPVDNGYEVVEQQMTYLQGYDGWYGDDNFDRHDRDENDDDEDYDNEDDNNGYYDNDFVDYGLGYRGNYKRNYGSSPWSGNND